MLKCKCPWAQETPWKLRGWESSSQHLLEAWLLGKEKPVAGRGQGDMRGGARAARPLDSEEALGSYVKYSSVAFNRENGI